MNTEFYQFPPSTDALDTSALLDAAREAGGLTIEVVLRPRPEQPAVTAEDRRIVTWSDSVCRRNASLIWQSESDQLHYRFRYADQPLQALNGVPPSKSETGLSTQKFVHLTVTIDETDGTSKLFVDGASVPSPSEATPAEDFLDTWDDGYRILVGNDDPQSTDDCTGEARNLYADWKLVAFHTGAMSDADVQRLAKCRDAAP